MEINDFPTDKLCRIEQIFSKSDLKSANSFHIQVPANFTYIIIPKNEITQKNLKVNTRQKTEFTIRKYHNAGINVEVFWYVGRGLIPYLGSRTYSCLAHFPIFSRSDS